VVALDCGANIGVHSVEWARLMKDWGSVIAVEAQERVFYALAGNLTLQNCFNARAIWAAVSDTPGDFVSRAGLQVARLIWLVRAAGRGWY
jgi:FkbM family methyltransferase